MKYSSGSQMRVGQLVWWNDLSRVGRIANVIEDHSGMAAWGLNTPGVFICFNVANGSLTEDVFYPESTIENEQIQPLSDSDAHKLNQEIGTFVNQPGNKLNKISASASRAQDGAILWHLSCVD